MKKALLSDIDGTISDRTHRLHYLDDKKDWVSFFNNSKFDKPIIYIIDQIENLLPFYDTLIFLTGRPDNYESITREWLDTNTNFKDYRLMMRKEKDYRDDVIIKKEMLDLVRQNYSVEIIFEDQKKLCTMWKKEGLKYIRAI